MATAGRDTPNPKPVQSQHGLRVRTIAFNAWEARLGSKCAKLHRRSDNPHLQAMSDSQRFPVAAHTLAYLSHLGADAPERAVSSAELAGPVGPQLLLGATLAALDAGPVVALLDPALVKLLLEAREALVVS
jgi:hypothetical protein